MASVLIGLQVLGFVASWFGTYVVVTAASLKATGVPLKEPHLLSQAERNTKDGCAAIGFMASLGPAFGWIHYFYVTYWS
jgi:hypothetical protein